MRIEDLTGKNGYTVHRKRAGYFPRVLVFRCNPVDGSPHPLTPWVLWNVGPDGCLFSGGYFKEFAEASAAFDNRERSGGLPFRAETMENVASATEA
jgi:hypothetical protein